MTTRDEQRREQERSQRILASLPQGFLYMDADFRVRQINDYGLRIDGRQRADILGRTHWECWPGSEQLPIGTAFRRALREGVAVNLAQFYVLSGKAIWFDVHCFPADGGLVVLYRDITERKLNEQALAEREEQLRLAIDAADVGEWDVDMASQVMFWPARVKAMFGIAPECPVTLDDFYGGVHPDDRAHTLASFANTADPALRSQYDSEYRTVGKDDGRVRWVAARGRGLFNAAGECIRIIGTAVDVTERKQIEATLRQSEEHLRRADRIKDEFLAMLAHELRNPLAPISAAAALLQMGKLDEERVRRTSQIISRQVNHMISLVDDLLDVSRVTSGLVALDQAALDVRQIIADAVEQVTPLIRARGQHLEVRLAREGCMVLGDMKRLVQVIANVLHNAAKYTQEGGVIVLETTVPKTALHDAHVQIAVADNGIGMVPELVSRVFELFAQAERSSDRSLGGLGLGLALVNSLVGLHGGEVTCESAGLGHGSTFTIRLPRLVVRESGPARGASGAGALQAQGRGLRIMVVDDNVDAADMLSMLLGASGHEVWVEHTAQAALERARHDRPDVCLLDIGLPDASGYELAQRLRAIPATAGALLVAVTGYGQEKDRAQSLAAGFDHHLVKPVDVAALGAILAATSRA